ALLVIIQMVAEAVRIRAISLKNRWSDLSQQIQWSGESGVFRREIQVRFAKCNPKAIRMPVPVADEQCPDGKPTINIVGRDGQCMNVKDSQYYNGNFIILGACGNAQHNQLWTFKSDGTIRSNGKCLTNGYGGWGAYIMIFDCDIVPETATNSSAEDNNSSRQAWSAGNYTQPTINYISGFREMCLQANGANARVWLANYVFCTEPK
nr:hypothetical protein [Tanacetum cinerariifolium]